MSSNDTLPVSYLDRPLRTEAEALADYITRKSGVYGGFKQILATPDQFDLIIRALRAYKPTGEA